ncbi:carbonic anhydrase 9-like [Emydura macquarii macquarii]|uniref:carbonic anhydrase 9-like n=1 Tax=Emydura macquarii macquarii TaxID=1129001 RepID=UPI00352A2AEF
MNCTRLGLSLLLLTALGCTAEEHGSEGSSHPKREGPGHSHWSYADKAQWKTDFPDCGGQMQSPINIDTNSTMYSRELQAIVLSGSNLDPSKRLGLMNNGHTVVLRLPESLTITDGYPQEYRAMQLHFHWGSPQGPGSEHTVDGHRYDGEIHVVYYNPRYNSIKQAMTQPDGLAVLAAFLQVGPEKNTHYQPLLEQLHEVQETGEETTVAGFNIRGLLPSNLDRYYRYRGSLTTPPCYQTVNWTVFNQTVLLSQEQLSVLETTLQGEDDEVLQNNFRLPQPLHGRGVLASFQAAVSPRRVPLPDSEQLGSSLHTGDVLAILFGILFAVTALAFLIYIYKQRSQSRRPDSHTKPNVIYTAATPEENMG